MEGNGGGTLVCIVQLYFRGVIEYTLPEGLHKGFHGRRRRRN